MIKRMATLSIVILAGTGLAGCSLVDDERDEAAEQLVGRTWVAEEISGQPAAEGVASTLVIAGDGKVNGNTGCNGFFGSVILDGSAMSFGNLGATRRACSEPASGQEIRFMRALDMTRGYHTEEGRLLLLDGVGRTLARFSESTQQ